jgi:hypothetical protein
MLRLIRTLDRNPQVVGLLLAELGEFDTELFQVKSSHFFVQVLGQEVHTEGVLFGFGPQLDLGQNLVGETGTHHEGGFVATLDFGHQASVGGVLASRMIPVERKASSSIAGAQNAGRPRLTLPTS